MQLGLWFGTSRLDGSEISVVVVFVFVCLGSRRAYNSSGNAAAVVTCLDSFGWVGGPDRRRRRRLSRSSARSWRRLRLWIATGLLYNFVVVFSGCRCGRGCETGRQCGYGCTDSCVSRRSVLSSSSSSAAVRLLPLHCRHISILTPSTLRKNMFPLVLRAVLSS